MKWENHTKTVSNPEKKTELQNEGEYPAKKLSG